MAGELYELRVLTERTIGSENSDLGSSSRLQFRRVDAFGRVKEWNDVPHHIVNTYVEWGATTRVEELDEDQFYFNNGDT